MSMVQYVFGAQATLDPCLIEPGQKNSRLHCVEAIIISATKSSGFIEPHAGQVLAQGSFLCHAGRFHARQC